jgi:hypothetical protein
MCTEARRKAPLTPQNTHSLFRPQSHTGMYFEINLLKTKQTALVKDPVRTEQ